MKYHKNSKRAAVIAALMLASGLSVVSARGANYVWVGSAGAPWNDATSWNAEAGGAGAVPTTADRAVFADLAPGSGPFTVDAGIAGQSLGSLGFGTTTPTATSPALTRNVTLAGGTISLTGTAGGGGNVIGLARPENSTGGVTIQNNLTLAGATEQRFNIESGAPVVVDGTIGETGGSRGLHKVGAGTLVLDGDTSYTGLTTARTGLLQINGLATGGGAYSVLANGTLGGVGTITGNVTVSGANSAVSPGIDVGAFHVNGDVNFSNGSLLIQLDGNGSGSSDLLSLTGALTLSSTAKLSLSSVGTLDDAAYVVATYASRAGTFAPANIIGLPSGYTLDYNFNGQNQIAVVAVPEPSIGLMAGALALLTSRRRIAKH